LIRAYHLQIVFVLDLGRSILDRKLTDIQTKITVINDGITATKAALVILDKELGTDKQERDKAVGVALPWQ
jgi:hypothetical protein